jgi:hypothetical protein
VHVETEATIARATAGIKRDGRPNQAPPLIDDQNPVSFTNIEFFNGIGHEPSLINTGNFLESGRSNEGNLARAFCGASEVRRGLSPEILGIQPPPGVRCILDKPFESSRAGMTYHVILRAAGRSLNVP